MSSTLAVSRIAVQPQVAGGPSAALPQAALPGPGAANEAASGLAAVAELPRVDLATATERLNRAAKALASELRFVIHAATHQIMVRVIDGDGNVVREIPPERVLDAYARMMETLGLLVDERV